MVMRRCGLIRVGVLGFVLSASGAAAQDFDRYREFELGSAVAAVATLTGVAGSELKAIHQRPAVIQELTWKPRYGARRPVAAETESLDRLVFDFYDDRLFRVTVDYDRKHTEGLMDGDMIEALSAVYGSPATPIVSRRRQPATVSDDAGAPIAEWGNADNSVRLQRLSSYGTTFRLVITAESVATLARTAAARAVVLDAREAPQREAAREKKEVEDRRAAEEKARLTNKATFRP
jgi:hypothetical protein